MEGLLPFVYRAIVHKRDGHRAIGNPFLNDDPAAAATAYKRLATCDSGTYSRPATTVDAPFLGGAVVTVHSPRWLPAAVAAGNGTLSPRHHRPSARS
ncbi:hypothetical protein OsI_10902 [Oryza sativa Indica Group]|jgi:hypothetical protein|uniref:Uncharacterized protein n=1 Tax=Oryza sativa subsp. indica TaxID=39946 RepID=B8AKP2_ORYSI|nr:hypothetical protein OsI_10902 [Oryza sativa Indica Group]KAF2938526.1 hypothetical protein DAI22_03g124200 [Oryza sativa Japonica Group]